MAYRRSIAARVNLFYQPQRISPSISNIHRRDNDSELFQTKSIQHRFSVTGNNFSNYHNRRFAVPAGYGMAYSRNYSSAGVEGGEADKIEGLSNVVGVLKDMAAVNQAAVAAADSFFPVAALQYVIDYVHCFTGFNWWASIVVTTLIIRFLEIPFLITQIKAITRLAIVKQHLNAVKEEMENKDMSDAEIQAKIEAVFEEYNVSPFTIVKGLSVFAPIFCTFSLAIRNMAAKVPSFQDGGILWFTDLSTPDSLYILPVLNALAVWAVVECKAAPGMDSFHPSRMTKNVMRGFAALTIPVTAIFPKALFFYWLTFTMHTLVFGLVMKMPQVKKYLGIPIVPVIPPSPKQIPNVEAVPQAQKSPTLRLRRLRLGQKGQKKKDRNEKVIQS